MSVFRTREVIDFINEAHEALKDQGYTYRAIDFAVKENLNYFSKNQFDLNQQTIRYLKKSIAQLGDEFLIPQEFKDQKTEEEHFSQNSIRDFSENIANQLNFRIREIRQELFESPEPPFESTGVAVDWIRQQANLEPNDTIVEIVVNEETRKNIHQNYLQSSTPVTEENPHTIKAIGIRSHKGETISFPGKDGWVECLPISSQGGNYWASKLARLKAQAESIAQIAGWQEQQAVMHILTGGIPLLPAARIEIKHKGFKAEDGWRQRKYASVTFFDPYITRTELIALNGEIRKLLKLKHVKKVDKNQYDLINFVRSRSENHSYKGSDSFWQGLADEWANLNNSKALKGNSFYKRYVRACEKLSVFPIRFKKQTST